MARARTIPPDVLVDYDLFQLERKLGLPLRLAWLGMPGVADREGRFEWKPHMLKLQVLPWDEGVDFARVLEAFEGAGLVRRYTVDGQQFGDIPTFHRHQRPHPREAQSKLPQHPSDKGKPRAGPGQAKGKPKADQGTAITVGCSSLSGPSSLSSPSGPSEASGRPGPSVPSGPEDDPDAPAAAVVGVGAAAAANSELDRFGSERVTIEAFLQRVPPEQQPAWTGRLLRCLDGTELKHTMGKLSPVSPAAVSQALRDLEGRDLPNVTTFRAFVLRAEKENRRATGDQVDRAVQNIVAKRSLAERNLAAGVSWMASRGSNGTAPEPNDVCEVELPAAAAEWVETGEPAAPASAPRTDRALAQSDLAQEAPVAWREKMAELEQQGLGRPSLRAGDAA